MRFYLGMAAVAMAMGTALGVYGIVADPHLQPPAPSTQPAQPTEPTTLPVATRPKSSPTVSSGAKGHIVRTTPGPVTSLSSNDDGTPTNPSKRRQVPRPSAPLRIAVPALDISSTLGPARGLKANGTIDDAPLSGPSWSLPWWYEDGPAPGQPGSAVILGHVDSAIGAGHLGVFFRLGELRPGQRVVVSLADGLTTRWVVTSTRLYADDDFPNAVIYDRSGPAILRLVTCGGSFDWQAHQYDSAIVVTARPLR